MTNTSLKRRVDKLTGSADGQANASTLSNNSYIDYSSILEAAISLRVRGVMHDATKEEFANLTPTSILDQYH